MLSEIVIDHRLWPVLAGLAGLCTGSLLNVVIYRLPRMLQQQDEEYARRLNGQITPVAAEPDTFNLFLPASHCPQCKTPVAWYDNIPLFSWILLRGRCRHCHQKISVRYPVVEALMALTAAAAACWLPPGISCLLLSAFGALLLSLALIDYDCQLLPDSLTLPLLWLGLIWHCVNNPAFLPQAIAGAIAGYLTLWLIYWGARLLSGREGLGYGDFKLLAALGAWFGWQSLPLLLLIAALLTLATMVPQLCKNRRLRWLQPTPFGPGLAAAGCLLMISHLVNT